MSYSTLLSIALSGYCLLLLLITTASAANEISITQNVQIANNNTLPSTIQFSVSVLLLVPTVVYDVVVNAGSIVFTITGTNTISGPSPVSNNPDFIVTSNALLTWQQPYLNSSQQSMNLVYIAQPAEGSNGNYLLPEGKSFYNATVSYQTAINSSSQRLAATSCINRVDVSQNEVTYNNAYVAITVILGLLVGAGIVVLVIFLIYFFTRQDPFSMCQRKMSGETPYQRHRGSSVDANSVSNVRASDSWNEAENSKAKRGLWKKKENNVSSGPVNTSAAESLIKAMQMKSEQLITREIERWTIRDMVTLVGELRTEWPPMFVLVTQTVVESLSSTDLVSNSVGNKCFQTFSKRTEDINKKYARELGQLDARRSEVTKETQAQLNFLNQIRSEEMQKFDDQFRSLSKQEKEPVYKLFQEEQHFEKQTEQLNLKLAADIEIEKLESDIFTRRCRELKAAQQQLVTDIVNTGKLNSDKSEWITTEMNQATDALLQIFNDALSQRVAVIKEQLIKRKYLVKSEEYSKGLDAEVLNQVASQQLKLITMAKRHSQLSESEVRSMREQALLKVMSQKESSEKEQTSRELDLCKRSSEEKKMRLADLIKKHELVMADVSKKQSSGKKSDTLAFVEMMQTTKSEFVKERVATENQLDVEHMSELRQLRKELIEKLESRLLDGKERIANELHRAGLSSNKLESWLDSQDQELKELRQEQKKASKQNDNDLKKSQMDELRVTTSRQQTEDSRLSNYKHAVIRKLLDSQTALTSEEREKLQRLCETATCVTNEANLTVSNQLSVYKYRADKSSQQRNARIEELARKHELDVKKMAKQQKSASSRRYSDDEGQMDQELLELIQKYREQRISCWNDDDKTPDDDGHKDEAKDMVVKDQANAIRRQEEDLGTMIAEIQIKKAKPMVEVAEKQNVIYRLTFDLINEATEQGVLSNTMCQKLLQKHTRELEKINIAVDEENRREEKKVLSELTERQKEKQDNVIRKVSRKNRTTSESGDDQIKVGLADAEQLLTLDRLELQFSRESHQTTEEVRRRCDVRRWQLIQDQELEFLADITKLIGYSRNELESVISSVLPVTWSADRRKHFIDRLCTHCNPGLSSPTATKKRTELLKKSKSAAAEQGVSAKAKPLSDEPTSSLPGRGGRLDDNFTSNRLAPLGSETLGGRTGNNLTSKRLAPIGSGAATIPAINSARIVNDDGDIGLAGRYNRTASNLSSRTAEDLPVSYNRIPRLELDKPAAPVRPIIKPSSSQFEAAVVHRPSSSTNWRSQVDERGYDEPDSRSNYLNGKLALPPPGASAALSRTLPLPSSASLERKRKTVRVSESHQYYSHSDYDDDW